MVEPGTVLLGKYRIERVLGQGGMGVVAQAHHLQLDQPVAIKFLLPEVLENRQVVQRFIREAQAAVKLKSQHVCRVIDVGELDSGAPYMVMEYLEGHDLKEHVSAHGQPPQGVAVDFVLQACEALAEAHALGIVHRDIKPANLFVTRGAGGAPLLKVLDFGISKAPATGEDDELTHTKAVLGTPAYMSPEQLRSSKHVDPRSDIWALGIVLYQLLCGRRPFRGGSFSEICMQVATDPVAPIQVPMPAGLADAVMRCLEKDADRRFQNVAELAAALAPYAHTQSLATTTVERTSRTLGVTPAVPAAAPPAAQAPAWDISSAPPSTISASVGEVAVDTQHVAPRRRWAVIAATAVILLGAGLAVVLIQGDAPREEQAAAASAPVIDAGAADAGMSASAAPRIEEVDAGAVEAAADDERAGSASEAEEGVAGDSARADREPDGDRATSERNRARKARKRSRSKRKRATRRSESTRSRSSSRERTEHQKELDTDDLLGTRN